MKMKFLKYGAVLCAGFVLSNYSCTNERYPKSLSPEESLQKMKVHEDFQMEIFATEPYVKDPISMVFDEENNAYVVEMADYPFSDMNPNKAGEGKGRIVFLKDTDGDGVIDESTVFIEGISEITSVLPWKGGLLVTAAPDILYLKDTNGDGKADKKEVLFTGFFTNNSEAQITNLRFGIDNWIYASNHGQAGTVSYTKKPEASALSMGGSDFRFRLDKELFELETAPAQFGQALNDWGHRFMTQNTIHIQQAVIPRRYMERHPYLPSKKGVEDISDHGLRMYQITPAPYWRAERSKRRQEQYDEQGLDRVEHPEGYFTGASGGTIYAGDKYPEEFYGNIFTGEVAGNLVHRDVLVPHDTRPTYIAERAKEEQDEEFISSTDSWFRPTDFTLGPDGNLYVIDMYRQHIETPLSIPEDLLEDMDYTKGMDMGRIYRIVYKDSAPSSDDLVPKKNKTSQDYVKLLEHPNQWWRLQAQRVLIEKQDKSVIPQLEEIFKSNDDPRIRLHALYSLEGLDALNENLIRSAMKDPHPGLREHGAMLSERFPESLNLLAKLTEDESPRVSFQATLSLGQFSSPLVIEKMADIIEQKYADNWYRLAVLSSDAGSSYEFFKHLRVENSFFDEINEDKKLFIHDLAYILAGKDTGVKRTLEEIQSNIKQENREEWLIAFLDGMTNAYKTLEKSAGDDSYLKDILEEISKNSSEDIKESINNLLNR